MLIPPHLKQIPSQNNNNSIVKRPKATPLPNSKINQKNILEKNSKTPKNNLLIDENKIKKNPLNNNNIYSNIIKSDFNNNLNLKNKTDKSFENKKLNIYKNNISNDLNKKNIISHEKSKNIKDISNIVIDNKKNNLKKKENNLIDKDITSNFKKIEFSINKINKNEKHLTKKDSKDILYKTNSLHKKENIKDLLNKKDYIRNNELKLSNKENNINNETKLINKENIKNNEIKLINRENITNNNNKLINKENNKNNEKKINDFQLKNPILSNKESENLNKYLLKKNLNNDNIKEKTNQFLNENSLINKKIDFSPKIIEEPKILIKESKQPSELISSLDIRTFQDIQYNELLNEVKNLEKEEKLKKENEILKEKLLENEKINKLNKLKNDILLLKPENNEGIKFAVSFQGKKFIRKFSKNSIGIDVYLWISSLTLETNEILYPEMFDLKIATGSEILLNKTLEEQNIKGNIMLNIIKK